MDEGEGKLFDSADFEEALLLADTCLDEELRLLIEDAALDA